MLVKPEKRQPMAELLYTLELGEKLAHQCAVAQAMIAPTEKTRQFLEGQAKQESYHAIVFRTFRLWIAPGHGHSHRPNEPLEEYTSLLMNALHRKDFFESILAEQVILESLGEAVLQKLEAGLQRRNAPFQRLRNILLHQEAAHHGFGERVLEQAMTNEILTKQELQEKASPYLVLSSAMIMSLETQFREIDEDPGACLTSHNEFLPEWLLAPQ